MSTVHDIRARDCYRQRSNHRRVGDVAGAFSATPFKICAAL
jgi:hypothetical protein